MHGADTQSDRFCHLADANSLSKFAQGQLNLVWLRTRPS